jgi:formiminotetrahydrofolate cyclodeaminase
LEDHDSLVGLLESISSKSPAPGGGSVAALSGCFGASCIMMVCNLTIGKKKYQDVEGEFEGILREAGDIQKELFVLSKKDTEAFNEVMAAYKTPEDSHKDEKIQAAYKNATQIPYETAQRCLRLMELAQIATKKGNRNALSDSGVGALLAHSGVKGALLNVRVNLNYIDDGDFIEKMDAETSEFEKTADQFLDTILDFIENSLSPRSKQDSTI